MVALPILLTVAVFATNAAPSAVESDEIPLPQPTDLCANGAFGLDQVRATVFCDSPTLRFSALSDGAHLFVQAVLWTDHECAPGGGSGVPGGRPMPEDSILMVAVRESGEPAPGLDRTYRLGPGPQGARYSIGDSSELRNDSAGRCSFDYLLTGRGLVRVDSFLIPLDELGVDSTSTIRLAYRGWFASPRLIASSVDCDGQGSPDVPSRDAWHRVPLAAVDGVTIEPARVPDLRDVPAISRPRSMPAIGTTPPKIDAERWFNWDEEDVPTLGSLRGKVVVVVFWSTWCGSCVAMLPKLDELHREFASQGIVLLAASAQLPQHIEAWFAASTENRVRFVVAAGSEAARDYGVFGMPAAYVIGRRGALDWSGHPAAPGFEEAVRRALAAAAREERD